MQGQTTARKRQKIVRDFESGELPVLINCGILIEGADLPAVSYLPPTLHAKAIRKTSVVLLLIEPGRLPRHCPADQVSYPYDSDGTSHVIIQASRSKHHISPSRDPLMRQLGRGARLYEGKQDCLVLDFTVDHKEKKGMQVFSELMGVMKVVEGWEGYEGDEPSV
jgi:hypothetical protein